MFGTEAASFIFGVFGDSAQTVTLASCRLVSANALLVRSCVSANREAPLHERAGYPPEQVDYTGCPL